MFGVECSWSSCAAAYAAAMGDRWEEWARRVCGALEVEPTVAIVDVLLAAGVVLGPSRAGGFLVDLSVHGPIRSAFGSPMDAAPWSEEVCRLIDTAAGTGCAIVDALELVTRNRAPAPIPIESE